MYIVQLYQFRYLPGGVYCLLNINITTSMKEILIYKVLNTKLCIFLLSMDFLIRKVYKKTMNSNTVRILSIPNEMK